MMVVTPPTDQKTKREARAQQGFVSSAIRNGAHRRAEARHDRNGGQAPKPRRIGVAAEHHHYKWWALSCTSLGMLLATINSGTLIIALPDLERSLHTGLLELVWVILVYMIASTVLVLSAGRLSDQFGRKKAYIGGFVVFGIASLGAGFAGSGTELIMW